MALFSNIHFDISERKVLLRLFDILAALFFLYLIGSFFEFDYFILDKKNWIYTVVLTLYLAVFGTVFELYNLQKASQFQAVLKNTILTVSVTTLVFLLTPFYTPVLPENRLQIVFFYVAILSGILIWRGLYIGLISSPRFYKRVLLVGDTYDISKIIQNLEAADPNYKIIGYVAKHDNAAVSDNIGIARYSAEDLVKTVKGINISEIVVAGDYGKGVSVNVYNQLIELLESGFSIREYTQVYEEVAQRIPVEHVGRDFYTYFPFSRNNQNKFYQFSHRLFDIISSIIGLSFLGVIIPLVFLLNFVGNRGPLFYTQTRVGRNGSAFKMIKLRTMVKNAEKEGALLTQKNDNRITTFGRFMRNTRIDEIPQFINILIGHMSVIGPRPERPEFVKKLSAAMPFYETRHVIKPGLTGWAQVKGDYVSTESDMLQKLQYDLYYIKHRNLFLDLSIVLKTVSTVIFYRGQ